MYLEDVTCTCTNNCSIHLIPKDVCRPGTTFKYIYKKPPLKIIYYITFVTDVPLGFLGNFLWPADGFNSKSSKTHVQGY